jgi:transglutaminase-like putative cysteine protease
MRPASESIEDYLKPSVYIDWRDKGIAELADRLYGESREEIEYVERAYRFVRDEIKHSWHVQARRVTAKASQVLREKVGICGQRPICWPRWRARKESRRASVASG